MIFPVKHYNKLMHNIMILRNYVKFSSMYKGGVKRELKGQYMVSEAELF